MTALAFAEDRRLVYSGGRDGTRTPREWRLAFATEFATEMPIGVAFSDDLVTTTDRRSPCCRGDSRLVCRVWRADA